MAQTRWLRGRSDSAVALAVRPRPRRRLQEARLHEAARWRMDDWRIWYDLGIASTGSQRDRAFVRAVTLNPLGADIEALREQGHRLLPAERAR